MLPTEQNYVNLMTASDVKFEAKLDTKTQDNIMSVYIYNKIVGARGHFRPSTANLQGYGGQILQNEGITMIKFRALVSNLIKVPFYVTKKGHAPILGLHSSCTFNLNKFAIEMKSVDGFTHIKTDRVAWPGGPRTDQQAWCYGEY